MINICLIGSKYHCDMVRKILQKENDISFISDLKNADLLYIIYGPGVNKKTIKYWIFTNKPVLIHWIGKDTFIFRKDIIPSSRLLRIHKFISLKLMKYRHKKNNIKFISSAPWLADEVSKNSRIDTEYLILTSIENNLLLPPKEIREFDILSYVPVNDFELYYGNDLLELVKLYPNKKFCIVCPDIRNLNEWPYERFDNLVVQPRTDKNGFLKLLNNTKVFVRLKDGGDAIALSVLEALAHGTRVVWNLKFDYCDYETRESFKRNINNYFLDEFKVNHEAIDYVKKNYDIEKWKSDFKEIIFKIKRHGQ